MTAPTRLRRIAAGSHGARKKTTPMKNLSLGIDVARLTFVAALWFGNGRFAKATFDNQVGGFRKLRRWLQAHNAGHVRCALESTNSYGEALAEWLYEEGHAVHVLN